MQAFAGAWGIDVEFFALPSAVFVSAGPERLTLHQSTPEEPHLQRLDALTTLADQVVGGTISTQTALIELDRLQRAPDPYGPAVTMAAFTVTGAAASVVFGGGPAELMASTVTGTLAGLCAVLLPKKAAGLTTTLAAVLIGAFVTTIASLTPLDSRIAVLSGLLVFLPGFSLTVGMTELATGHHLTGSSRVLGAGVSLLQLGFGIALGTQLVGSGPALEPTGLVFAAWSRPIALVLVSAAFTVLLRAPKWAWPRIALATATATLFGDIGTELLGPALAPALGALAVTLLSNGLSRITGRPTALTQVPGILLLVPGSLGFEAVQALLAADALAGVQGAFSTGLAASGLVGGMLLGHALVPPDERRDLGRQEALDR